MMMSDGAGCEGSSESMEKSNNRKAKKEQANGRIGELGRHHPESCNSG